MVLLAGIGWRLYPAIIALLIALSLLVLSELPARAARAPQPGQEPALGLTLSPQQIGYLRLPWNRTFQAAASLSPDIVRIGAYWDQIEPARGKYEFGALDRQLQQAANAGLQTVLTVGMKAPRWPEYYLPGWLEQRCTLRPGARVSDDPEVREAALSFVTAVVERYRESDLVSYWQVENEPLDAAGPKGWTIGADMVRQEQALVKRLDPAGRPVVASLLTPTHPLALLPPWRLPVERRALDLMDGADILGMDVYPSIGLHVLGRDIYLNWMNWSWDAMALRLQRLAEERGKQAWVMEAQAEPWEPREGDASGAGATPSLDPARAVQVYERLREGGFQAILLWGVEHWYVRRERYDDNTWWEAMAALFVRDVNRSP